MWKAALHHKYQCVRNILLLLVCIASGVVGIYGRLQVALVCGLLGGLTLLLLNNIIQRLKNKELRIALEDQAHAARALLRESNMRRNTAELVQKIGEVASLAPNIESLIESVVKAIQDKLAFDRIIFIYDDSTSQEPPYIVSNGYTQEQTALYLQAWQGREGDTACMAVSRMVTGHKPFMMKDLETFRGQNDHKAVHFLQQIGAKVFIVVPILYENRMLGVLAADYVTPNKTLSQTDVSLFMGIAAQTAVSIMNVNVIQKIRESEAKYRILADNVSDVIWILNIDQLAFEYVSPSIRSLVGYFPEEYMTFTLEDLLLPDSLEKAQAAIFEELMRDNEEGVDPYRSRSLRLEQYHRNGSTIWIEVTARFLRDDSGQPTKILGVSRDISERLQAMKVQQRLQEKLERAHKMEAIGQLAGGVAHDLNNILSGLVSYPELILSGLPEDSALRRPLETILASGKKAAAIVQDLLTLARRGVSMAEVLNLNKIIREYLNSPEYAKMLSFHSRLSVTTHLAEDPIHIKGSPVHISKTLMNLVSNAAEAIPDDGEICITTVIRTLETYYEGYERVEPGDYIVLSVSDTGTGIEEHEISRIFEPFYTKKVMGRSGTGLGMSVVWGTVKDLDGFIDVHSKIDQGTTFSLYFPVSHEEEKERKPFYAKQSYQGNGETILVVDDSQEQRVVAAAILQDLGYKSHTVTSGKEALRFLKEYSADLVILDMIMEAGMDGLDTYRQILQIHPGQKALIASGFSETDRVRTAQQLGAGEYIKKPYTIETIGLAVRKALDEDNADIA